MLNILWKLSYSMIGVRYKFFKDIDFYYVRYSVSELYILLRSLVS